MATKTTKKTTKKTTRKPKKNIVKETKVESPYSGLILIASIIILFIIVVPKGEISREMGDNEKKELSNEGTIENINKIGSEVEPITISGKTYVSESEALKALRPVPQTRRTSDETKFVESYKYE